MKRIVLALLLFALSTVVFADQTVRGYTRRDGTYVAPHHRTEPNQYRFDNYGSRGNTNPYTGRRRTKPNEFSTPPVYNRSNRYGNAGYNNIYNNMFPPSNQRPKTFLGVEPRRRSK